MKKVIPSLLLFFIISGICFAEPKLESYLINDLELKRLLLEYQKANLDAKKNDVDNGVAIELSSGTARFQFNDSGTNSSVTPTVTISVPKASNLSLKASSTLKFTDEENNSSDTSVNLGIDIISSTHLNQKINQIKAARAILEAKRAFQNRALEAEKEFYSEMKNLFENKSTIISKQKDLYEDSISFDEVKAKGYSQSSSKYRQAYMKVLSDKHEIDTVAHTFEHNCAVFAAKCGIVFESNEIPEDFLPEDIADFSAIDILSFEKKNYAKIEKAVYAHELAELQRKAEKDFTLSVNSGYTMKNSNTSFTTDKTSDGYTTSSSTQKSDTVDIGLNATWQGLSIGTGVNIPLYSDSNPVYSVSASIKPNVFRNKKITKQTNELTAEQEMLSIQAAEEDYNTAIVDKQTELQSIEWAKETNLETFDMWSNLEKDEKRWFDEGIVKESEYLNAFANRELYRIKLLINKIDLIIYNNSTKLLFCRDEEFK